MENGNGKYGNFEEYDFCARTAARVNDRGMTIYGLGNFRLRLEGDIYIYRVRALVTKPSQERFVNRDVTVEETTSFKVTAEEITYALDHGQFARIGHEQLAPLVRPKKSKKKK